MPRASFRHSPFVIRHSSFVIGLCLLLAPTARAVELSAGPMVGHVTDKSVRLWMQFPIAGEVTINTFEVQHNQAVSGVKVGLSGPTPFVCDVPLNNLQPNSTYRVEVKFDGDPVKLPGPELTLRTAPASGEEETFSIAFGGGINIAPLAPTTTAPQAAPTLTPHKLPIFQAITDLKPRAFLFLGNTGTLPPKLEDFPTTHRAAYRYIADFHSLIRREPDLQPLFRTTACYGIYSDRDFGPLAAATATAPAAAGAAAGGGLDFVYAPESLVAFQRFWPNPDWGTPENPGCFSTCTLGDTDFFLLDTRTFRTDRTLLGAAQLAWLEKNLQISKANFKILAAPSTLWGDDPQKNGPNSWSHFPDEQKAFLRWLGDNQIGGIVALAANQSTATLAKLDPDPAGKLHYPLYTLATSTLANAPGTALSRLAPAPSTDTFGTLDFGGTREHRFLTLRLHNDSGKTLLEQTVLAVQLKN